MITEVLLILPLYLILFFICWRLRPVVKAMTDVENTLNDHDFFGDAVDTPKEGIEQHKKRECLKSAIGKGKLGHKWIIVIRNGKIVWKHGLNRPFFLCNLSSENF